MTKTALDKPQSFSPSSLSQFTTCPLAFRFSYIDKIQQPPQLSATKGSVVHRALELLFLENKQSRTLDSALNFLNTALNEYLLNREYTELDLDESEKEKFKTDCMKLIANYFQIENPSKIRPLGLELKLEATINNNKIRGVIDRLEITDEGIVVTDYKTGKAPSGYSESSKLNGVHIYALLCKEIFGILPSKVKLIYLSAPLIIEAIPDDFSTKGASNKSKAIINAVEKHVIKVYLCLANRFYATGVDTKISVLQKAVFYLMLEKFDAWADPKILIDRTKMRDAFWYRLSHLADHSLL